MRALRSKRTRPSRMVISGTMRSVPSTLPPARSAEAEVAVIDMENGNVGEREPTAICPELGVADSGGGIGGGFADDLLERDAEARGFCS